MTSRGLYWTVATLLPASLLVSLFHGSLHTSTYSATSFGCDLISWSWHPILSPLVRLHVKPLRLWFSVVFTTSVGLSWVLAPLLPSRWWNWLFSTLGSDLEALAADFASVWLFARASLCSGLRLTVPLLPCQNIFIYAAAVLASASLNSLLMVLSAQPHSQVISPAIILHEEWYPALQDFF